MLCSPFIAEPPKHTALPNPIPETRIVYVSPCALGSKRPGVKTFWSITEPQEYLPHLRAVGACREAAGVGAEVPGMLPWSAQ